MTPLVALKSKLGELDALRHLRAGDNVVPMIELPDSVDAGRSAKVLPALIKTAVHIADLGRSIWIDTQRLAATGPLARQPGGPLEFLDNRIETASQVAHGLFAPDVAALIPVVPDVADDALLARIALLQEHRQRDVVVRIGQLHTPPAELVERVRRVARRCRVEVGHLHAILDAGFVEATQAAQVDLISSAANALCDLLGPGSMTLLADSIPPARHDYVTTVRDRAEVSLWNAVADQAPATKIQYGDYGVVHPTPPQPSAGSEPRTPNPYLLLHRPRSDCRPPETAATGEPQTAPRFGHRRVRRTRRRTRGTF
jgi:hypothetical protein